jgi:MFS family permease
LAIAARGPSPRPQLRDTWTAYGYLSLWAYLLYALGNATPYLQADLHLTQFEAGLHGSALAVGVLASGLGADAVGRAVGSRRLLDLAVAFLCSAVVLLVVAPTLAVSLGAALLLGIGGGTVGMHVNIELSRSAEAESRKLLARGNAWSMVTAMLAPLAIGTAATLAGAWRVALLIPVVALAALTLLTAQGDGSRVEVRAPRSSLPRDYWIVWLLLVLAVAIEFSTVFWGSTIVAHRTGVSNAEATLLASLFVAGMLAGRTAIGGGVGARARTRLLLAGGLGLVLLGAGLVAVSTVPLLSGLGLLLTGLGTAGLWPIGLALAMRHAGNAALTASARATLAAGLAVLLAPSALGLAADAVGVVAAWPIVLAIATAGLLVLALAPRNS